jgi:hypothetical protein
MYLFPILWDEDEEPPNFVNLKQLDVSMCFHEYNLEAVISMLYHCPVLESVRLIHEVHKLANFRFFNSYICRI